jgi:hypothetical protein
MKFKSFKVIKICLTIKIKIFSGNSYYQSLILQPFFQSTQHFYEKREGYGVVFRSARD